MSERAALLVALAVALTAAVLFAVFVSFFGATVVGGGVGLVLYLLLKPNDPRPDLGRTTPGGWVPPTGPPPGAPPPPPGGVPGGPERP